MSPLALLIIQLLELAVSKEPEIAASLQKLFANGNPTPADWQAFHDSVAAQKFEDVAPAAAANLPPPQDAISTDASQPGADGAASQSETETAETVTPAKLPAVHPIYGTPL
jgi:hypothetical protein